MDTNYHFSRRQLLSLAALMLLSPALRLFPGAAAKYALQASALTAAAALPSVIIYIRFICRFISLGDKGQGLAELSLRCLGERAGRAALIAEGLWLTLYGGFVLRSGADRLISNVYPYSSPLPFIIVMGLICCLAALSPPRSLVRAARLIMPLIFGILIIIFCFSLSTVDIEKLGPVTLQDTVPVLKSSTAALNIFSAIIALSSFFAGFTERKPGAFRDYLKWALLMTAFLSLLCITVIGNFGAKLSLSLSWPFFALVRNLVFFSSLQRTEALTVALWVLPDFLLVSALIFSAQHCIRLALGEKPSASEGRKIFSMENKRFIIPLCSLICVLLALFMAPEPHILKLWSEALIPLINMSFSLIFIPALFLIGKHRKKI